MMKGNTKGSRNQTYEAATEAEKGDFTKPPRAARPGGETTPAATESARGPRTPPGHTVTSSTGTWEQTSWETYDVTAKKLKTDKDEAERIELQDWARGSSATPTLALGSGAARGDGDRLGYQVAPELRVATPPHMAMPMDEPMPATNKGTQIFANIHESADMEERYGDKFSKAWLNNEKPTGEEIEVHENFTAKAKQSMHDLAIARKRMKPKDFKRCLTAAFGDLPATA